MRIRSIACSGVVVGILACAALQIACVTMQPATEPTTEAEAGTAPTVVADRVVQVSAERFLFTPSEITIEAGTTLEIRLTSSDTDHGFRIAGPNNINIAIPKRGRGEAKAIFVTDEPGEYVFQCSRVCGAGHNYMRGVIRVTPRATGQHANGGSR